MKTTPKALAAAFALWALPLVLTLAFVVPPFTNTDETFHMLRAVQVAHGHMMGARFDNPDKAGLPGSGGLSDMAIFRAFAPLARLSWLPNRPDGEVTGKVLAASEGVTWDHDLVPVWFGSTAQYPPVFYLPDVAGYWMGRAGGMRVDATLRLSRALNGVVFVGLAALALARARRLRPLLAVILMLPMTVALGASANQDAGMIAVTALVVAQLDRIADEKRQVRTVELVCLAVALACVGAARPPYLALLLMLLPIAPGARGWVALGTAGAAAAFWCGAVALYVMRPLGQANPAVQISGLLAHPGTILTIVGHTLPLFATSYAWQFIGQLGWNDVPLPLWYRGLAACALGVGVLASRAGPGAWFYHSVAGVFLAICAIFVVQYVDWTAPGTDHVDGVVGRYFIPLALIAGLAVPCGAWGGRAAGWLFPIFLVLLALTTPAVMMHHILHHYYIAAG